MDWNRAVAARTLAQEVRGEPLAGQEAVAWTLRNRVADGRWGKNLASVCLWRGQFSGWYMPHDPNFTYACGLADEDPMLVKMATILDGVMAQDASKDPTHGATHYYSDSMEFPPPWVTGDARKKIPAAVFCGKFGRQLFWKGVQ